ncbi:MAG: MFS transporter [Bacillota bacterium]
MIQQKLKSFKFQRNASLYLKSIAMSSLAQGAYGVIQGLYIMSLGFDEAVLGTVLSMRMLAAAIASVPAGIVSDNKGRKPVLVAGGLLTTAGYLGMAVSSSPLNMIICSCIVGVAQACQMTSGAPLLAESSTKEERASLFGVNFSLSNFVNMIGSLLGGILPRQLGWLGQAPAFRVSLVLFSAVTLAGALPAYKIKEEINPDTKASHAITIVRTEIQSLIDVMRNKDVSGLLIYKMIIGFGAGLVVPFFNVFLSGKLQVDTAVVGLILSFSHGATALAGLIAPSLASKYGKVKTVVGTQLVSIPFLLLIAIPPNIYLVSVALFMRSALMNMSNPVASNFSMEIVEPNERGKVSSLIRISDNISRSLSAAAAGYIMSRWNYEAPYLLTAILYFAASVVYWKAFRGRE